MLCTARNFSTRNAKTDKDYYDPNYRSRSEINYDRPLYYNNKNGYFDMSAFFYNITRIKKCYSRFSQGEEFYGYANNEDCKFSLLYGFKEYIPVHKNDDMTGGKEEKDGGHFPESDWFYLCSFKNAEVVQAFYDSIDSDKIKGQDICSMFADFFSKVSQFKIFIDNKEYKLDFSFLETVTDFLRALPDEEKNTFNAIYSGSNPAENIKIKHEVRPY